MMDYTKTALGIELGSTRIKAVLKAVISGARNVCYFIDIRDASVYYKTDGMCR